MTGLDPLVAALAYAEAGWYVVPVARGTKHPGSVLGKRWPVLSTRDPEVIASHWAGTDHGVALHVGRSGAVVLDIDHPDAVPDDMGAVLRDARAPMQRTRRDEPRRGHLVFAAPPGRVVGNGLGSLPRGWGEIRGANGVVVVAPSVHPDSDTEGGLYEWVRTGPVPALPEWIASRLTDATESADAATDDAVRDALASWTGHASPEALRGPRTAWEAAMGRGDSRHDTAVSVACWAAREARAGLYPLREAIDMLTPLWLEAMSLPIGSGRTEPATRARAELAGIVAWAVGQALAAPQERLIEIRDKVTHHAERRSQGIAADLDPLDPPDPSAAPAETGAETDDPSRVQLPDVDPDDLWSMTPVLAHIRHAAHATGTNAWAVLGCVLARVAAATPPTVRTIARHGGDPGGSLNVFTLLLAGSGIGKGDASTTARTLFGRPAPHEDDALVAEHMREFRHPAGIDIRPGTGEGIATAFVRLELTDPDDRKSPRSWQQYRTRVLFEAAEIQEVQAKGAGRSGATLLPVLREVFNGSTLGSTNATDDLNRYVAAGSYRAALIIHAQPALTRWLWDDAAGGTPQRFAWFDAVPDLITLDPPEHPGPLDWHDYPQALPDGPMEGPEEATAWFRRVKVARALLAKGRPLSDLGLSDLARDPAVTRPDRYSQAPLVRSKIACVLALLHQEAKVSPQTWEASGLVMAHSYAVVERYHADVAATARRENVARGAGEGEREVAKTETVDRELTARAVAGIRRRLERVGREGATVRDLRHALKSTLRGRVEDAVARLVEAGVAESETVLVDGQKKIVYRLSGR